MVLDSEENELLTNNNSILSGFNSFDILFEDSEIQGGGESSQVENDSLSRANSSIFISFINLYSAMLSNFFLDLIDELQVQCVEASFEFKIFTILVLFFLLIILLIAVFWRLYGPIIDNFYKNQSNLKFFSFFHSIIANILNYFTFKVFYTRKPSEQYNSKEKEE